MLSQEQIVQYYPLKNGMPFCIVADPHGSALIWVGWNRIGKGEGQNVPQKKLKNFLF
jgi:hypothetical protein